MRRNVIGGSAVVKTSVMATACLVSLFAANVFGQPLMQSQVIRSTNMVLNELGQPLVGTDPMAAWFGIEPVEGAHVQVLMTHNGVVYPPQANGQPDARNPKVWEAQIGQGISPNMSANSAFSTAVTPRPPFNQSIVIRVFNRPTVEESSFYGDSVPFTISPVKHEVFEARVAATDQPIDPADADNDGINNAWEKVYGMNPLLTDSDGDGLSDLHELLSGSNPNDIDSYFAVDTLYNPTNASVSLSWESHANRLYRIEVCDPENLAAGYTELRQVEGIGGPMVETIYGVDLARPQWYRMKAESLVPLPFQD